MTNLHTHSGDTFDKLTEAVKAAERNVYDELADVFAQAHIERLRRMEDETE